MVRGAQCGKEVLGHIPNVDEDSGRANATNQPLHVGVEDELAHQRGWGHLAERTVLGAPQRVLNREEAEDGHANCVQR